MSEENATGTPRDPTYQFKIANALNDKFSADELNWIAEQLNEAAYMVSHHDLKVDFRRAALKLNICAAKQEQPA